MIAACYNAAASRAISSRNQICAGSVRRRGCQRKFTVKSGDGKGRSKRSTRSACNAASRAGINATRSVPATSAGARRKLDSEQATRRPAKGGQCLVHGPDKLAAFGRDQRVFDGAKCLKRKRRIAARMGSALNDLELLAQARTPPVIGRGQTGDKGRSAASSANWGQIAGGSNGKSASRAFGASAAKADRSFEAKPHGRNRCRSDESFGRWWRDQTAGLRVPIGPDPPAGPAVVAGFPAPVPSAPVCAPRRSATDH